MSPLRKVAAAVTLVAAGALSVPLISSATGGSGTAVDGAGEEFVSTGARTEFIPVSAFRVIDTRSSGVKIDSALAGDPGRNQLPVYALAELGSLTPVIPDQVVAVSFTATAVQTEGKGYMHVDGFGYADGSSSTIVWNGSGERIANSGVAMLTSAFDDLGFLGVYVGGDPGAKSHVIIDITGFFVTIP